MLPPTFGVQRASHTDGAQCAPYGRVESLQKGVQRRSHAHAGPIRHPRGQQVPTLLDFDDIENVVLGRHLALGNNIPLSERMSIMMPIKFEVFSSMNRMPEHENQDAPQGPKKATNFFELGPVRHKGSGVQFTVHARQREVLETVRQVVELINTRAATREAETLRRLVEAAPLDLPTHDQAALIEQARRNQAARQAFLDEFAVLSAIEVHELVGSTAKNPHASANRLRTDNRIFAIRIGDEYRYPAFQFDAEGRPLPIMRELLQAAEGLRGWGLALWLTAPNGFLDGDRPLDLLREAPERIIEAVRREIADAF